MDTNTDVEQQLRALTLRGKPTEHAMLFYRCGYEAAKAESANARVIAPPPHWRMFCSGLGSGALASAILVGAWLLPSTRA